MVELNVLTPEITGKICAIKCGSTCCNFRKSGHFVPVEIVDFTNLKRIGAEKFVTFHSSVEAPQLIQNTSGNCVFLNQRTKLCNIYEFRPLACRNYPYREDELETADIPDWCELYHTSSSELEESKMFEGKKRLNQYIEYQSKVDPETLLQYLDYHRKNQIFQFPEFKAEFEIIDQTSYIRVKSIEEDSSPEILGKLIDGFQKKNTLDWRIFNVIEFGKDFSIIRVIDGVWRRYPDVNIPIDPQFPQTFDAYARINKIIRSTREYFNHWYYGAKVVDEFEEIIKDKVSNVVPVNSEFL